MAATITASMAGELARKVSAPSKPDKNVDEKFGKLKSSLDELSERLDPKSTEFIKEQDALIDKFKVEIGFDEFPIKDQKKIIEDINSKLGSNYNTLLSIQSDLNNTSSLLYKTINKNINGILSAPIKAVTFSKSVIEQLSESIKNKVQNIAPIKSLSSSFMNIKAMIGNAFTKVSDKVGGFIAGAKSLFSSIGSRMARFNPIAMISDMIKKILKPIIDAIKYVAEIIMKVLTFIMQFALIAFQFLITTIVFLFTLTTTIITFLFTLTTTIITLLFTLATTVITLLFTLVTAIITALLSLFVAVISLVVSIFIAAITLMTSLFIIALTTMATVFLAVMALFAFLIFTVMELLLVSSLIALLAVALVLAIVLLLIPILAALLISNIILGALILLTTVLLLLFVVPILFAVIFFSLLTYFMVLGLALTIGLIVIPLLLLNNVISIATLVMTGILLATVLFIVVPLILGVLGYLIAIITPMLAFITLLCLISSIAGILIIAIVLIVAYMLYKAWQWLSAFYKENIKPIVDLVVSWFNKIWDWAKAFYENTLKPIFDKIVYLWNTYLQPVIDWITGTLMAVISWIWDAFKAGWDFVSGIIKSIWDFISNPAKMIASAAKAVGNVVSESFSAVTDKLSSWGKSVTDTLNPMNWFAEGKIALEPIKAVVGEAGPEAAIPLDDAGLAFLKKTFNIDDNSFSAMINSSDLYKAVLDIKDQNIEIKKVVDDIENKISDMGKPTFFESVSQSYTNMFSLSPTTADNKAKKENPGDTIMKKLNEIQKLIENMPVGEGSTTTQTKDSEMDILKLIASGMMGRR